MGKMTLEKQKAKNPVVFTYRYLNMAPDLDKHLADIYQAKNIPASVNARLMQICEITMRHFRNMGQMGTLILTKYADKGPDGTPTGWPNGPFVFSDKELEVKHDKEMTELFDTKIVLPIERLSLQNLEFAGLSGACLRALDFMVMGLPKAGALPEGVEKPEGYVPKANSPLEGVIATL